jgi:hypothetical protein
VFGLLVDTPIFWGYFIPRFLPAKLDDGVSTGVSLTGLVFVAAPKILILKPVLM